MEIALHDVMLETPWGYERSYTPQERQLSDAHKSPYMQRSALRDFDNSTRMIDCGVLLECMCRTRVELAETLVFQWN